MKIEISFTKIIFYNLTKKWTLELDLFFMNEIQDFTALISPSLAGAEACDVLVNRMEKKCVSSLHSPLLLVLGESLIYIIYNVLSSFLFSVRPEGSKISNNWMWADMLLTFFSKLYVCFLLLLLWAGELGMNGKSTQLESAWKLMTDIRFERTLENV